VVSGVDDDGLAGVAVHDDAAVLLERADDERLKGQVHGRRREYSLAPGTLSEPPPMELVRGKRPTVKPCAFLVLTCALLAAAAAAWWFERPASPEKFEPDGSGKPGAGTQAPPLATLHPRAPGTRGSAVPAASSHDVE